MAAIDLNTIRKTIEERLLTEQEMQIANLYWKKYK